MRQQHEADRARDFIIISRRSTPSHRDVSTVILPGNGQRAGGAYSQLLPQLEQQAVFNSFNFNLAPELETSLASASANATGSATFLDALLCPSDPSPAGADHRLGGEAYASHNYDFSVGSTYPLMATFPSGLHLAVIRHTPQRDVLRESRGSIRPSITRRPILEHGGRPARRSGPPPNVDLRGNDPTRVFLVTGDNKTSGAPLTSDADYASLCLGAPRDLDHHVPGDQGRPLALRCPRAHHV